MTHYVVAIEFAGPDLLARVGGARRPIRDHAFDIHSGTLAHGAHPTRVGFPQPQRGWSTASAPRSCGACRDAVTAVISARIKELVARAAERARRHPVPPHSPETS